MRLLSGHNPSRYEEVSRWPVREALLAAREIMRDATQSSHRYEMIMWRIATVMGAKIKQPEAPATMR